jgi:hypothetical protein
MESAVILTYRVLPRKPNFFGRLAVFNTTQSGRFLGVSRSVQTGYRLDVLVSGYQSIDMHCMVMAVKFVGGLSISGFVK